MWRVGEQPGQGVAHAFTTWFWQRPLRPRAVSQLADKRVIVSAGPSFVLPASRPRARVGRPSQSLWRLTEPAKKRTTHTTDVAEADGVRDVFK
jgi:hypothetical protein